MAPLSIIGNITTIVSLGIICYYIFREPLSFDGKHADGDLRQYPMFFCTILFALEAIVVVNNYCYLFPPRKFKIIIFFFCIKDFADGKRNEVTESVRWWNRHFESSNVYCDSSICWSGILWISKIWRQSRYTGYTQPSTR